MNPEIISVGIIIDPRRWVPFDIYLMDNEGYWSFTFQLLMVKLTFGWTTPVWEEKLRKKLDETNASQAVRTQTPKKQDGPPA